MSCCDITESGPRRRHPWETNPGDWVFAGAAPPACHLLGVLIQLGPGGSAPPSLSSSSVKWDCPASRRDLHYNECGGSWALGPGVATLLRRVLCSDLWSKCSPLPVLCPAVCAAGTGLHGVRGGALTHRDLGREQDASLDLEHAGPSRPQRFGYPGPDPASGSQPDPQTDSSSSPKACVTWSWPSFSGSQSS